MNNIEGANERSKLSALVRSFLLSMATICVAIIGSAATAAASSAIVTDQGLLEGIALPGLNEYLGIPYAAPPVGRRRWTPPHRHGLWHGLFQATQFGSECTQPGPYGTEDCLFLNVFTPSIKKNNRPVMVWIHGGGLVTGGGDMYDPTQLVVQGGVIVVTINYRLGVLGFFAHPALYAEGHRKGNYGLMDQQFALAWVHRNIAAFGGNPNKVTIFGESAGGLSVYSNLASPTAAGLFHRAIAESGAYASFANYLEWIVPIAVAETRGTFLVPSGLAIATRVKCFSQTAQCLRGVPASTLVGVQAGELYPFVDGKVLTRTPGVAFARGKFNKVPVISGTNHDEYRLFVALLYDFGVGPLTNAEYSAAVLALWGPSLAPIVFGQYPLPASPLVDAASLALGASGTDGIFACPARHADRSLSKYVPTYTYEFNDENAPGFPGVSFPLGAYHFAEVQYLFTVGGVPASLTSDQQQLSNTMIGYWTHFAKTADPNFSGAPVWSTYSPASDEYQSLVPPTPMVESNFAADHLCTTFWDVI